MKVYIASSFDLLEKVIDTAQTLWENGIQITIAWWKKDYKKIDDPDWYSRPDVIEASQKNFDAIDKADAVLLVCPDFVGECFNEANVAVGYAIAKGKPVYSIGVLQRSEMYVPIIKLKDIDEFLKEVKK